MNDLNDIITSRVRVKILNLFFSNTKEIYHVRGVVREVGEEINAVRRELDRLEKAGLFEKEGRGNRVYYGVRKDYPTYSDLLSIVSKSTGVGQELIANKNKLGKINYIMFSGKFVRRKNRKREDNIDVLIVGDVHLPELAAIIRKEESKRGHEINYTVMTREELSFRKKRRDPFLLEILSESRVMILGDEDDLVS